MNASLQMASRFMFLRVVTYCRFFFCIFNASSGYNRNGLHHTGLVCECAYVYMFVCCNIISILNCHLLVSRDYYVQLTFIAFAKCAI